jgi:hypothetical protein
MIGHTYVIPYLHISKTFQHASVTPQEDWYRYLSLASPGPIALLCRKDCKYVRVQPYSKYDESTMRLPYGESRRCDH